MANRLLRERREKALLTQEELAEKVGAHEISVRRWEAGNRPQAHYVRRLCEALEASPPELGFLVDGDGRPYSPAVIPRAFGALGLDPDDEADIEEIEAATLRLRRSYSTTRPAELLARLDERLRQVRRMLSRNRRGPIQRSLIRHAAWLSLLRATVQADLRRFESAASSVFAARQLAREAGDREAEAWTWETDAWLAATDGRQLDARELASAGMAVAPAGTHGLVAVTLQRARINGALGDEAAAVRDLLAGEQALAAAGPVHHQDDHYEIDPAKAAFFASGAMAALHRPAETIEHAAEVVRASEDHRSRNYWPMRVANARLEWAMALVDQGEEDEAAALARVVLSEPRWFRPDTERRARMLLDRMRDPRLRADNASLLEERLEQG